jgi:hypothetical protein
LSEKFIGTWKLVSYEMRSDDEVTYPLGKDAVGYLMYNDDGYVSAALMASKRRRFMDMMNPTTEEIEAAGNTYIAYCGKYEVTEDKVTHLPDISFFPNWVGEKQERFYKFEGDKLILSPPPMTHGGKQHTVYLTWKRVK